MSILRLGDTVSLVVEVPRFSFVKRGAGGEIDFVSPVPCPFNYGSVPGTLAGDGDALDVVLLGPRRSRGATAEATVVGIVDFVDAGARDPKHVCSTRPSSAFERATVRVFFVTYARAKRLLHRLRGKRGRTAVLGVRFASTESSPSARERRG